MGNEAFLFSSNFYEVLGEFREIKTQTILFCDLRIWQNRGLNTAQQMFTQLPIEKKMLAP